jgi:hypothetical protein
MSRRERDTRVRLDGMTDEQLEIVRHAVSMELIGRAGDLRFLGRLPDPRQAVKDVAALGRLAFWLHHGEVLVPDRVARQVAQALAEGVDSMNEEVFEAYEEAMAEHDALHAFVAHLSGGGRGPGR